MIYLIVGFVCLLAFARLAIKVASKVQKKKRGGERGKEPTEKTGWLQTPSGKNWSTAGTLTAIYLAGFWLLYGPLANWLRSHFGCTETEASVMVTLFGLAFIFPAVWLLYSAANIPGDPKTIKRGMRAIAFAMLVVLGYFNWSGPSELFNPENGNPKFWIDKATGEIIYDPSADSSKTRYSPRSGHRLEIGNPEDVKLTASQQSGSNPLQKAADAIKNLGAREIPIVILDSDGFIDSPDYIGPITYIIPKGDGWATAIRPRGRSATIDPQVETLVQACGSNGEWKPPIKTGPFHKNAAYFNGATAIRYHRLPERDNPVPTLWWN